MLEKTLACVSVIGIAVLPACNKSGTAEKSEKPAELKKIEIEKFGLAGMVPAGTRVSEGLDTNEVMVSGDSISVTIKKNPTVPEDLQKAKSYVQTMNSGNKPTNLREEKLADGWLLTFETSRPGLTNYQMVSLRTIGGTPYECSTIVGSVAERNMAIEFCKSLAAK